MINIHHILVPTDFSEYATRAITFACDLASLHGASLDIVHVLEEPAFPSFYNAGASLLYGQVPDIRNLARQALDRLTEELQTTTTGISINAHLVDGHAADCICSFARENKVDLIVIPTHGLTGLKHILMGSVAERVVREAHCPVFVFK